MEIKKDLQNVLLSFGTIALVLFVGSDIYVRQELSLLTQDGQIADSALKVEENPILPSEESLGEYIRTLEEGLEGDSDTEIELVATPEAEVAEQVVKETPIVLVTETAPVAPTPPTQKITPVVAVPVKKVAVATTTVTKSVTPTTTIKTTPVKTVTVKKSRQSRAS